MKSVSELNLDKYSALEYNTLKPSVEKQLLKFWDTTCQRLGLTYKFGADGYLTKVDINTLGTGWIIENVQWASNLKSVDMEEGSEDIFTLGELLNSREAETELFQLQINPTNIEKLLVDKHTGLAHEKPLYLPIEVVHLPETGQIVVGGGRHRLVALATLFKVVRGYENFKVAVHSVYPRSMEEVARYVEMSNTSRSMPKIEKEMLHSAASGENLTLISPPEDFFERARQCTKVAELKGLVGRNWLALLKDTPVGARCTEDTIGAIGSSFMTKFCRGLNNIEAGTDSTLLLIEENDGEEVQIYEAITRNITTILATNWNKFLNELKKPDLDRNRVQKEDENGVALWKIEIKRDHGELAQMLADLMLDKLGEQLKNAHLDQQARKAEDKKAKKLTSKAKSLQSDIDAMNRAIKSFEDMGITVSEEMRANVAEKQRLLAQEIGQLQSEIPVTAAPQQDEVMTELDSLLT